MVLATLQLSKFSYVFPQSCIAMYFGYRRVTTILIAFGRKRFSVLAKEYKSAHKINFHFMKIQY